MLIAALETKVATCLAAHRNERDDEGHPWSSGAATATSRCITLGAGTIPGAAKLTPDQLAQLTSGQCYVNLHTAAHPAVESRGQLGRM